jgi:crotonobetainyl-CoA:carnitine CoA-transferase CaiB-like acyl-CoA transferase
MPPAAHIVTRPRLRSRRSSSSSKVPIRIEPVAPIGWPSAIGPPLTLSPYAGRPAYDDLIQGLTACVAGLAATWSKTPPSIRHYPPRLGEHGEQILGEAGFSESEIGTLIAEGALVNPDS